MKRLNISVGKWSIIAVLFLPVIVLAATTVGTNLSTTGTFTTTNTSTSAVQFQNAAGTTTGFKFDTSNNRLLIGKSGSVPLTTLEVGGTASVSGTLTLAGIITSINTGSNTFSGSLNLSNGFTANSYQGGGLTNCTGSSNAIKYQTGQFSCGAISGAAIASNSLGFGALHTPLTLQYNEILASSSNAYNWAWGGINMTGIGTLAVKSTGVFSGTGSSSFAGSLNTSLGLHAVGNVTTSGLFLSTGVGSNSFSGSLNPTGGLTVGGAGVFSGTGSSSFAGSLLVSKGFNAQAIVGTNLTINTGNLTGNGTGSSSFAGSLNITKGLHAVGNVTTSGLFLSTGVGSNSFSGSLNPTGGLTVGGAGVFSGTGSSSFAGSLNITKGLHATGNLTTSGLFLGTGTGSNSFSGSLNTTGGLTAGGAGVFSGVGSSSFAGSLLVSKGIKSNNIALVVDQAIKPTTTTWTVASDQRIKTDINNFTDGLDTILKIRPITYVYNGLGGPGYDDTQEHIGIIAQELEKVAPYMIETSTGFIGGVRVNDFKSYQGHALPFILVNAVKELNAKQDFQTSQIASLLSQTGGFTIGGGTTIKKYISNTFALNFATQPTKCQDSAAQTVTGATLGDTVVPSVNIAIPASFSLSAFVSAPNTVVFRWCEFGLPLSDPDGGGAGYRVDVWQH